MDDDGEMSMEEAMMDGMDEEQFAALDTDGDGTVTKNEFKEFVLKMAVDKKGWANAFFPVGMAENREFTHNWNDGKLQ